MNIEIILFSIVGKMTLNNIEKHFDQQKENSSLKNKVALSGLSLLTALGGTPEAYGNALRGQLQQNYKKEIGMVLSDKSEEVQEVTADYMEALSQLDDQVKGPKDGEPTELTDEKKKKVIEEFKNSLNINGDSLSISKVFVRKPETYDLVTKSIVNASDRKGSGKYAYLQDYILKATMNPKENKSYADKLKTLHMDMTLQKVMIGNRHMLKLNNFWVESSAYNVTLNESKNKMTLNDLLVFDMKGATAIEERVKSIEVNYDKSATREKLESKISSLPFELKFDKKAVDGLPDYMKHIDLARLLMTSIKWSSQAKLEDLTDLKNWSRALVVNGATTKELTDVAVKFNDDKVAIEIQQPKDFKAKLFGFDLQANCTVLNPGTKNEKLQLEFPSDGDNGLKKFKEHFVKSFREFWQKTNKTHLGDQNVFQNLNKVAYDEDGIMTTKVSPSIITADPSTGFEINVTSRVDPLIIRNVIEKGQKGEEAAMKFMDDRGRILAGNRIQHGKNSSISLGDKEGGYKLEELRGAEQPYTYLRFWWSLGSKLANAIKSFNPEKWETVCRNKKGNKEMARIPVKAEDQDASPKVKKEVGYFYDQERGTVQVSADNFSYLLSQASNKEQSLMAKGLRLWLSDTQVYAKFSELFDKAYGGGEGGEAKESKVKLKGLIVDGRYATVDVKEKGKYIEVNENVPEKVQDIIRQMETYLIWVDKLDQMKVRVSPEGKAKENKSRNLFESVGGEHGVGRTPIIAWTIKNEGIDKNQGEALEAFGHSAKYVVIDGKGEKIAIEFDVSTGTPSLKDDKIGIDKVTYDLSYDRNNNTLYLLPPKVK